MGNSTKARGPGTVPAPKLVRVSADQVRAVCRSYKPTRRIAAELATSTRTVERRLEDLRLSGYRVSMKIAWDGQHKRVPHYRVLGKV